MPADQPFTLRTERLTLRLHEPRDRDALLSYYGDPKVARFLLEGPWDEATTSTKLAERIARTGLDSPARALALVVELEGRVIGDVALWATDETGAKGEIGWVFHPDAEGHGYATEAAAAVLQLAFERYGLHRVEAQMDARNVGSASLCARIGMLREGLRRRDWWSKGEWTDSLMYAALATDQPRDHGDAIVVSAVTLRDAEGRVLTVRKRGTSIFMQPGGKPDPGESPEACALREVREELGLDLDPRRLELTGVYRTAAANETGRPLIATVFSHPHLSAESTPDVAPAAEIEEVRWLDPRERLPDDTAPLLRLLLTP